MTNILSNVHGDDFNNVTSEVLTRLSFDLAWWPREVGKGGAGQGLLQGDIKDM